MIFLSLSQCFHLGFLSFFFGVWYTQVVYVPMWVVVFLGGVVFESDVSLTSPGVGKTRPGGGGSGSTEYLSKSHLSLGS
jgi:hypothetical protein